MGKSQVELFLERIRADDELMRKVREFEEKAGANALRLQQEIETNARANAYTIMAIAKEAGYEIPTDFFRSTTPPPVSPTDRELRGPGGTCCWVVTSCLKTCWWTKQ
jgi:hypothetical protein